MAVQNQIWLAEGCYRDVAFFEEMLECLRTLIFELGQIMEGGRHQLFLLRRERETKDFLSDFAGCGRHDSVSTGVRVVRIPSPGTGRDIALKASLPTR